MNIPVPKISKENKKLIIKFVGSWLIIVSVLLIGGAIYTGHFGTLLSSIVEIRTK